MHITHDITDNIIRSDGSGYTSSVYQESLPNLVYAILGDGGGRGGSQVRDRWKDNGV